MSPAAWWTRWRWALLSLVPLAVVALWAVNYEKTWSVLAVPHAKPYFFDTVAILAAGEAEQAGLNVYQPNPLDPMGRPHVYGPWWLVTGWLGLDRGDTWWVGGLLVVTFIIAAGRVLDPRDRGAALAGGMLLASPPILLAVERGNNDLVVFLLLGVAAAAIARPRVATEALAMGAVCLAAALKFYPLAALPLLAAQRCSRARMVGLAAISLAVCAGLFFLQHDAYRSAFGLAPSPVHMNTYGLSTTVQMWRILAGQHAWHVAGFAAGVVVAMLMVGRGVRALWHSVPLTGGSAACYLGGGLCWLLCFAATTNFPYRAVLWLLPARVWFGQLDAAGAAGRMARSMLGLLLVVCWLPVPRQMWAELARQGEGFGSVVAICAFEQALILTWSALLTVTLLGWAVRRWRAGDNLQVESSYV